MKTTKTIIVMLLSLNFTFTYAQNEKPNREAFTLQLPVDGEHYYEQEVQNSPYFVNEKILQIYPGEKLFVEVETKKNEIISMKVVKENLNPEKTLEINFTQKIEERTSQLMMLEIINPFDYDLEYEAMMFIVGNNKWINTNVLPVKAKLSSFEMWNDVVITLVLTEWKLR